MDYDSNAAVEGECTYDTILRCVLLYVQQIPDIRVVCQEHILSLCCPNLQSGVALPCGSVYNQLATGRSAIAHTQPAEHPIVVPLYTIPSAIHCFSTIPKTDHQHIETRHNESTGFLTCKYIGTRESGVCIWCYITNFRILYFLEFSTFAGLACVH